MYDELEQAVTGRRRAGLSGLGWIGVGLGVVLVMGITGSFLTVHLLRTHLRDWSHSLAAATATQGTDLVSEVLDGVFADMGPALLGADSEVRREILQELRAAGLDQGVIQDVVEGSLRIRGNEGDVTADLRGGADGGSLVIRSPEGDVHLRLTRNDDGGELLVSGGGEVVRLAAGGSVHDVPDWVPAVEGMPEEPRGAFSAVSGKGGFGVVSWETEADADELLSSYRDRLEAEGFQLRAEHSLRGGDSGSRSVVGWDEGSQRMVFMGTETEEGSTRVVLGYGEESR